MPFPLTCEYVILAVNFSIILDLYRDSMRTNDNWNKKIIRSDSKHMEQKKIYKHTHNYASIKAYGTKKIISSSISLIITFLYEIRLPDTDSMSGHFSMFWICQIQIEN